MKIFAIAIYDVGIDALRYVEMGDERASGIIAKWGDMGGQWFNTIDELRRAAKGKAQRMDSVCLEFRA